MRYFTVVPIPVPQHLFLVTLASVFVGLVVLPLPLAAQSTLVIKPSFTVIGAGGLGELYAVYDPDGPSGPQLEQYLDPSELRWSSSSKNFASVNLKGQVSGLKKGDAVITATHKKLQMTATAPVKIAGTVTSHDLATPDQRIRSYVLYVPEGYKANTPTPVVLTFHGGGGEPQGVTDKSQMNVVADQHGFLLAYPDGTGFIEAVGTWNAGACCGYAVRNAVDDVGYTRAMIADITAKFTVDASRIYATGLSNGAMMAHRLACELADQIAAIAPVAGGITLGGDFTACNPTRPVSVMEFHGTTDDNYPYNGGVGVDSESQIDYYPIPQTITDWVNRHNIPSDSRRVTYQVGIETCETYSSSAAEVTLCTANPPVKVKVDSVIYDGGGHAWPGGVKGRGDDADIPTQDISASSAMWEFFKLHPKP